MSKERLEEIKKLVKKIESILYDEWRRQELTFLIESLYYAGYVDWLIEQAERLEAIIKHRNDILKANEYLNEQNQRYKQALEYIQREIRKAIYTPKNNKWNSDFEREFEKGKKRGLIQTSDIVKEAIEALEGEK